MKIAILRNEDPNSARKWQLACEKLKIDYDIIDLSSNDWLINIRKENYDFFLLKPPGQLSHFKTLYDERTFIITKILKCPTYPSFEECYIYENKKLLSYYLNANNIPHPDTRVFYDKASALTFLKECKYPIVAKTSIGASGSGVTIIKERKEAEKYIRKGFSKNGIKRRFGPNRVTGSPSKWVTKAFKSPNFLISKIKQYTSIYKNGERDLIIFQEFIHHDFEWRVVKIGESYFAHKKIKIGDKASGSKGIDYAMPPESLLNFSKDLCEKQNFQFMAIDLFEDGTGGYLVNELQTIFGHVQKYILEVNGKPGRYRYIGNTWTFEEGDFNSNESFDLRLRTAISLYENRE